MSTKSKFTIRTATSKEAKDAAKIIGAGFFSDPLLMWMIENHSDRFQIISDFFQLYIEKAIEEGFVDLAYTEEHGLVGTAIWLPTTADTKSIYKEIDRITGENAPRFYTFAEYLSNYYPPVDFYYILAAIAMLPFAQGLGIGTALINERLHNLDKQCIDSYLEASTRMSAGGIYQRLGYKPVGEAIHFPKGIDIFPMWREARPIANNKENKEDGASHEIGSTVRFGDYNWLVLDVQADKKLLLSQELLRVDVYNNMYKPTTWEISHSRQFLNNDFYNSFNQTDKSKILTTSIYNSNNPWFGTDGGNDTTDHVFLLSIQEVVNYFGDSSQLTDKNQQTKFYINDDFNEARALILEENDQSCATCWWLRTPGSSPNFASFITADGRISISGDFVNRTQAFNIGLRPAMWVMS